MNNKKPTTKLITYFGGKGGALVGKINEFFPPKYDKYIEPYGGSATVLFSQTAPFEIYNDIYNNVYSLFKVISDDKLFYELKQKLDLTPFSEKLRKEYKEKLKDNSIYLLDRAYYYFYVNRTSVNGIGGFSVKSVIRRNISKSTSDYLSAIDNLEYYHKRLSNVIITNKDAIELIKKYNSNDVFIYLDPPYVQSTRTKARYECDMTDDKHQEMLNEIIDSKSNILLSGYDNDMYNILINNGWNKYSFKVNTVTGKNKPKEKIETLWYNYEIH